VKALAICLTLASAAFIAPSLVMLYAAVFGETFTGTQVVAAYALLVPGIAAGGSAIFLWGDR
jgi:hypothetical protein